MVDTSSYRRNAAAVEIHRHHYQFLYGIAELLTVA
jgi:hypothetical protein